VARARVSALERPAVVRYGGFSLPAALEVSDCEAWRMRPTAIRWHRRAKGDRSTATASF